MDKTGVVGKASLELMSEVSETQVTINSASSRAHVVARVSTKMGHSQSSLTMFLIFRWSLEYHGAWPDQAFLECSFPEGINYSAALMDEIGKKVVEEYRKKFPQPAT